MIVFLLLFQVCFAKSIEDINATEREIKIAEFITESLTKKEVNVQSPYYQSLKNKKNPFHLYFSSLESIHKINQLSRNKNLIHYCHKKISIPRDQSYLTSFLNSKIQRHCAIETLKYLKHHDVSEKEVEILSKSINYLDRAKLLLPAIQLLRRKSQFVHFKQHFWNRVWEMRPSLSHKSQSKLFEFGIRYNLITTDNKSIKSTLQVKKEIYETRIMLSSQPEKRSEITTRIHQICRLLDSLSPYLEHTFFSTSQYILGKSLIAHGLNREGQLILKRIQKLAPKYSGEKSFYILMSLIISENYDEALNFINSEKMHQKFTQLDSRDQFWISYTLYKKNKLELAQFYLNHIVDNNKLSYYSILSFNLLKKIFPESSLEYYDFPKIKNYRSLASLYSPRLSNEGIQDLIRIHSFAQVQNNFLSKKEALHIASKNINQIFNDLHSKSLQKSNKKQLYFHLAKVLNEEGSFLSAFSLIYHGLENDQIQLDIQGLQHLFPLPYKDEIYEHSELVDPVVMTSLIRQESGFNKFAKSRVGAMGLMQLMPYTAKRFSLLKNVNELYTPKKNLEIGSRYLKFLIDKYDGDIITTLAAYNAGESRANSWMRTVFKGLPSVKSIEMIPYPETRKYVKLIVRNIFFYKLLEQSSSVATIAANRYINFEQLTKR